jgi:hypothetical protein
MSVLKKIYNDIYDTLIANSTTNGINGVSDFCHQYENPDNFNLVKYPHCYIEESEVEWNKESKVTTVNKHPNQTGQAEIKVHVVYKTLKEYNKDARNEFHTVIDKVVADLQRLQSGNSDDGTYTTLMRVKEEHVKRHFERWRYLNDIRNCYFEEIDIR